MKKKWFLYAVLLVVASVTTYCVVEDKNLFQSISYRYVLWKVRPQRVTLCDTTHAMPIIRIEMHEKPHLEMYDNPQEETRYRSVRGLLSTEGFGCGKDLKNMRVQVRVRGNTTSRHPKHPYHIEFKKRTGLLSLSPSRDFLLLSNAFDATLLHNTLALELAHLLEIPYVNHIQHAHLVVNGYYQGLYDVTEQVVIDRASVDIDKEHEALFEIDRHMKNPYGFRSEIYSMPVSIKSPRLNRVAHKHHEFSADELLAQWEERFNRMERAVANISEKNGYSGQEAFQYIELDDFVNYFLLCLLTHTTDALLPKSLYMWTSEGGTRFHYGPPWDFDLSFGNEWLNFRRRSSPEADPFAVECESSAVPFTRNLLRTPEARAALQQRWAWFKSERLPQFWAYFDAQCAQISPYYAGNTSVWPLLVASAYETMPAPVDYAGEMQKLRRWIEARIRYVDGFLRFQE